MQEFISNVLILVLGFVLSMMESLYELLRNKYSYIILIWIIAALAIIDNLKKLTKGFDNLLEHFGKKDIIDDDTIMSVLKEIRVKLQTGNSLQKINDKIHWRNISLDQLISDDDLKELKNNLINLLYHNTENNNSLSLPIEEYGVKRAYRFLLSMYDYNYLTKKNRPDDIHGTLDGGVIMKFGSFAIKFPPEQNQPIHYYSDYLEGGYCDNPLEALEALIESGELTD
jgi:hypothetical protein